MKKEERKKAQVTIFVILGIVMLIMVYFILFAFSQISESSEEREMRRVAAAALSSDAVNYYMQSCLDVATTQAIDEILLQGGVLYDYQNGDVTLTEPGKTHIPITLTFPDEVTQNVNVSYSIRKQNNCPIINYDVPQYPRQLTYLTDLFSIYEETYSCSLDKRTLKDHSGFFGLNNITRLCINGSSNEVPKPGWGPTPCVRNVVIPTNNAHEPITIETQLKKRILEVLDTCVDFQELDELEGTFIELSEEGTEVEIILNRNSLSVKATYPFIAALGDDETTMIKQEYRYASPHRITRLHNYVTSLLAADTKDITFNLSSSEHQKNQPLFENDLFPNVQRFYDSRFDVSIINVNCNSEDCEHYKYDRVLVVQDKSSYIGGRPLTMATAIQNRNPALDLIGPKEINPTYHILVNVGDTLIISPEGYDPDDGNLTYKYSGWKETYNYTCNYFDCEEPALLDEPILTKSQLFQDTKSAVEYQTTSQDVGFHNVTIAVIDSQELRDYQELRILVFDAPATETSTDSIFDNLPENVASIEDPIRIRGALENSIQDSFTYINYTWNITNMDNDEVIYFNTFQDDLENFEEQELYFPNTQTHDADLLQKIKPYLFNVTGNYLVQFIIGINYTDIGFVESESEINLNVTQCIPFRSDDKIYPYSNLLNPFKANHTCCEGIIEEVNTYKLLEINYACYTATYYGEFNALKQKAQEELKDDKFENYTEYTQNNIEITPDILPSNSQSDVFKLTLNRYCDGKRGNMCAGKIIASLSSNTSCHNASLVEQCKGPPQITSPTALTCDLYTTTDINDPQTFETTYNMDGATGACQDNSACSDIGTEGYNSGGPNLCERAYCDGGECTLTFADECACNETCGAECFDGKLFNWTGNICKYGECDKNTCTFPEENTTMVCEGEQEYCHNETTGFCYYDVSCSDNGGAANKGEYCTKGELFEAKIPDNGDMMEVNVCMHGNEDQEDACEDDGDCKYDMTFFTCHTIYSNPTCQENGARCCSNFNIPCVPPTTENKYTPDIDDVVFTYPEP